MAAETIASDHLVRRRGLTRVQFDALVATGLLEDEPLELLDGELVEVVPQGSEHSRAIRRLNRWLDRALPDPWFLGVQSPLAAGDSSEPEPDLAVVRDTPEHPTTSPLVIEVAVSSQRVDLIHKPRVYALAGVEQYWVLDLPAREVVVHTGPRIEPGVEGYDDVRRLPWSTPLTALGVDVNLAEILGRP